jgi:predicted lipid-binding transport protein (Tim44 family)
LSDAATDWYRGIGGVFDWHDGRQRGLLLGSAMVVAGLGGLAWMFAGHSGSGAALSRPIAMLLVLGVLKIWHAFHPIARPARPRPAAQAAQGLMRAIARPAGDAWIDQACLAIGRVGLIAMALAFVSALVSIVWLEGHQAVVVAGVPETTPSAVYLAAIAASVIVGLCWSRISGANGGMLVMRGLGWGLLMFGLLLEPLTVGTDQVAEALIFAGATTRAMRAVRIESAEIRHGKGGPTYQAVVNPYHRTEALPPTVPIDQAAWQAIQAATVQAPADPDYPGDRQATTGLCLSFTVEQAGAAVRLLTHPGPYRSGELRPCPAGAA